MLVAGLQWSFSLLFQFPREVGNSILIPVGMWVKFGKILYLNFIPKQGDFGPWIGSKMWKSQIFFKKGKNFLKIWKMTPLPFLLRFWCIIFSKFEEIQANFSSKNAKTNYKTAKIDLNFSCISLMEIPAGIFPQS